ncbi:MAG: hypothetical protein ACI9QD_000880 [Thermoproteota archaeon]|jgi:hypothetical protein
MKFTYGLTLLLLLQTMISCTDKVPFTVQTQKETFVTQGVTLYSSQTCANHTAIKPKVDILFLIDNSSSTFYIPSTMKTAIAGMIQNVSSNFDYHVYVAPLIGAPGESDSDRRSFPLVVSDAGSISGSLNPVGSHEIQLFQSVTGGGQEHGFSRANNLISLNMSNSIFRKSANTLIVTVSNGDDNDFIYNQYGQPVGSNFNSNFNDLIKHTKKYHDSLPTSTPQYIKDALLKSNAFRFISVVAHSTCQPGYKNATNYKQMSHDIYDYVQATDQGNDSTPDSYDICTSSVSDIFSTVSSTIPVTIVPHVYDWWPVKNTTTIDFNLANIKVKKVNQNGVMNINESTSNGFEFINTYYSSKNIRKTPVVSAESPGEFFSGFFIKLHGSAEVVSPECLVVDIQDPQEFFGYIVISRVPDLTQLKIKINGVEVPVLDLSGNGYTYTGQSDSQNLRIIAANDDTSHPDGVYSSGYVFKLHGTSTYTNEDIIEVIYKPAPIN